MDRQTLYKLSSKVNDGNLGVQLATTKLFGMMGYSEPLPDELYTEVGIALVHLKQAANELNMFVFLLSLSEQS